MGEEIYEPKEITKEEVGETPIGVLLQVYKEEE